MPDQNTDKLKRLVSDAQILRSGLGRIRRDFDWLCCHPCARTIVYAIDFPVISSWIEPDTWGRNQKLSFDDETENLKFFNKFDYLFRLLMFEDINPVIILPPHFTELRHKISTLNDHDVKKKLTFSLRADTEFDTLLTEHAKTVEAFRETLSNPQPDKYAIREIFQFFLTTAPSILRMYVDKDEFVYERLRKIWRSKLRELYEIGKDESDLGLRESDVTAIRKIQPNNSRVRFWEERLELVNQWKTQQDENQEVSSITSRSDLDDRLSEFPTFSSSTDKGTPSSVTQDARALDYLYQVNALFERRKRNIRVCLVTSSDWILRAAISMGNTEAANGGKAPTLPEVRLPRLHICFEILKSLLRDNTNRKRIDSTLKTITNLESALDLFLMGTRGKKPINSRRLRTLEKIVRATWSTTEDSWFAEAIADNSLPNTLEQRDIRRDDIDRKWRNLQRMVSALGNADSFAYEIDKVRRDVVTKFDIESFLSFYGRELSKLSGRRLPEIHGKSALIKLHSKRMPYAVEFYCGQFATHAYNREGQLGGVLIDAVKKLAEESRIRDANERYEGFLAFALLHGTEGRWALCELFCSHTIRFLLQNVSVPLHEVFFLRALARKALSRRAVKLKDQIKLFAQAIEDCNQAAEHERSAERLVRVSDDDDDARIALMKASFSFTALTRNKSFRQDLERKCGVDVSWLEDVGKSVKDCEQIAEIQRARGDDYFLVRARQMQLSFYYNNLGQISYETAQDWDRDLAESMNRLHFLRPKSLSWKRDEFPIGCRAISIIGNWHFRRPTSRGKAYNLFRRANRVADMLMEKKFGRSKNRLSHLLDEVIDGLREEWGEFV